MKKQLIIGSLLFFPVYAIAGGPTKPLKPLKLMEKQDDEITFGPKVGFNYSNVWDEQGQDFVAQHKVGLVGGGFLSIPIWPILGFQPEILVSQKGFQGSGTMFDTTYSFTRTTTHLDIPLQLQVRIGFITLLAGPQYSFLLHERNDYRFGGNSSAQQQEFDNQNIRRNVLGFVGGADLNIMFLVISGRVGWDFQANHGDGSSSTPRYKNQWFQATAGFRF